MGTIRIFGADGDNSTTVRLSHVKAGNLNLVTPGITRVQWQNVKAEAGIVRPVNIGGGGIVDGTGIVRSRGDINDGVGDLSGG